MAGFSAPGDYRPYDAEVLNYPHRENADAVLVELRDLGSCLYLDGWSEYIPPLANAYAQGASVTGRCRVVGGTRLLSPDDFNGFNKKAMSCLIFSMRWVGVVGI